MSTMSTVTNTSTTVYQPGHRRRNSSLSHRRTASQTAGQRHVPIRPIDSALPPIPVTPDFSSQIYSPPRLPKALPSSLSGVPLSPLPSLSSMPGPYGGLGYNDSKSSKGPFRGAMDDFRGKAPALSMTRQVQRRTAYLSLAVLVAISFFLFWQTGGASLSTVPMGAASQRGGSGYAGFKDGGWRAALQGGKNGWRKAAHRAQLTLDAKQELAVVTAFMAALPENLVPAGVDPKKPIDPSLVVGFDTRAANARDELDMIVHDAWTRNPVVLFTKSFGTSSRELKGMMEKLRLAPAATVFDINLRHDADVLDPLLLRLTGAKQFPVILVGGVPYGGNDMETIKAAYADGTLQRVISEAGAKIDGQKRKGGRKH